MSTISDRKVAVRVTNTTEKPYLIKRNTQIAESSAVTPEQTKFIKPVDAAIITMIRKSDPDLTTYLDELLRRDKPKQQSNTFSFLTPENPAEFEKKYPDTNTKPQRTV